ncbi:hypothetical protein KY363_03265 [Candidatus Woesearchaeota archaeon]|nr:hypothetical protein [Candidatus Woesearchaeota archaeon]
MACGRDVSIEFVKIDGEQQVCKGSDYVTAVIDNVGTAEIDDFQIVLLTTSGVFRNESVSSSDPLVKGEAQEIRTYFSGFTKDDIVQAQFVPKLKGQGSGYTFCSDVALKAETMPDC